MMQLTWMWTCSIQIYPMLLSNNFPALTGTALVRCKQIECLFHLKILKYVNICNPKIDVKSIYLYL